MGSAGASGGLTCLPIINPLRPGPESGKGGPTPQCSRAHNGSPGSRFSSVPTVCIAGLELWPCPQNKGYLHKALTVCAGRRARFPHLLRLALPRGCLPLVSASCVLAACELSPSSMWGVTFSAMHRGLQRATTQPCRGFPSAPTTATCPGTLCMLEGPPGGGASTSSLLPHRWSPRSPKLAPAPALPPQTISPANVLQELGSCLGSDSGCHGVESTSWTLAQKFTRLSGSPHWPPCGCCSLDLGARRGLETWLSPPSCLWTFPHPRPPPPIPSSGRGVRNGTWSWALLGCSPNPHEPQS